MTRPSQANPPPGSTSSRSSNADAIADVGARPRVLLGHAGPVIAGAAQRILDAHGFDVEIGLDSRGIEASLSASRWDALVVDVALPGAPGFELTGFAREAGVKVVILVASVFRRTSYKRQPRRLYGADDYVEIHHLGDHLPRRLRAHLGLRDSQLPADTLRGVLENLNERGDNHLLEQTPQGLAMLIVADLLLYNGDRITEADTVEEALAAVAGDLDGARDLFGEVRGQVRGQGGPGMADGDLIGEAFRELVAGLDRTGDVS
jgi:DNA-binding response OmpR family regulator